MHQTQTKMASYGGKGRIPMFTPSHTSKRNSQAQRFRLIPDFGGAGHILSVLCILSILGKIANLLIQEH